MSAELYFLFDSHCPWSYATTKLVVRAQQSLPHLTIHFMPTGYYEGDNRVNKQAITDVKALSDVDFGSKYQEQLSGSQDSTLVTNIIAWLQAKNPSQTLKVLQALQHEHFVNGSPLTEKHDIDAVAQKLKLSIPNKCLQSEKYTKDAEYLLHDIAEIQEVIQTQAIPALLLANNDDLVLLNHNLYLSDAKMFVESIELELNK